LGQTNEDPRALDRTIVDRKGEGRICFLRTIAEIVEAAEEAVVAVEEVLVAD
jgi:hypothetical protein